MTTSSCDTLVQLSNFNKPFLSVEPYPYRSLWEPYLWFLTLINYVSSLGPIYHERKKEDCARELENAITDCLSLADEMGLSSICFPTISTGIYVYPKKKAVNIMITSADRFLQAKVKSVDIVCFIGYDEQMTNIMKEELL